MPGQVFQVVQCYSCRTFQVQQKKKTNKWVCKMCGEKQSIKKIYGEGSGADCRVHVQKLNTLRGEMDVMDRGHHVSNVSRDKMADHDEDVCPPNSTSCDEVDWHATNVPTTHQQSCQSASRWHEYIDDAGDNDNDGDDAGDEPCWTTDRQVYRRSFKENRKRKKCHAEPYTKKNDFNTSWRHRNKTNASSDSGYMVGNYDREYQDTVWKGNLTNDHTPANDWQDKPVDSDISLSTAVGEKYVRNQLCENSDTQSVRVSGPCVTKKSKSCNVFPVKASKWSSFVEETEDSDADSDNENLPYPIERNGRVFCVGGDSSFQTASQNQSSVNKYSIFEQDNEADSEVSRCDVGNEFFESDVHTAFKDQTSRSVLTSSRMYDDVHGGSLSSSEPCEISNRDFEYCRDGRVNNKTSTFTTNGKMKSTLKCQNVDLFTLGDIDEEDLDLDF